MENSNGNTSMQGGNGDQQEACPPGWRQQLAEQNLSTQPPSYHPNQGYQGQQHSGYQSHHGQEGPPEHFSQPDQSGHEQVDQNGQHFQPQHQQGGPRGEQGGSGNGQPPAAAALAKVLVDFCKQNPEGEGGNANQGQQHPQGGYQGHPGQMGNQQHTHAHHMGNNQQFGQMHQGNGQGHMNNPNRGGDGMDYGNSQHNMMGGQMYHNNGPNHNMHGGMMPNNGFGGQRFGGDDQQGNNQWGPMDYSQGGPMGDGSNAGDMGMANMQGGHMQMTPQFQHNQGGRGRGPPLPPPHQMQHYSGNGQNNSGYGGGRGGGGESTQLRFRTDRSLSHPDLYEAFRFYGKILALNMNKEPDGSSAFTGCGTVRFQTAEQADAAMENLHGSVVSGHMLYCEPRNASNSNVGTRQRDLSRLFVSWPSRTARQAIQEVLAPELEGHLPVDPKRHSMDVVLHVMFSHFGKVQYVMPVPDKLNQQNGGNSANEPDRAFIKFVHPQSAQAAMAHFENPNKQNGLIVRVAGPSKR